jgi:prephenate dehydrogenase
VSSIRTAAVIGLGLIGGSLARDLAALGVRVLAADRDDESVDAAVGEGIVERRLGAGFSGVETAEAVVIAVPVDQAPPLVERIAPLCRNARLVIDTGSTKRSIVAAASATEVAHCFVGAHPYAGDHRSGWSASRRGLFTGARVFLVQASATEEALAAAHDLWRAVGALPETISAEDHDELLARTSHLPHVASSALALVLSAAGVSRRDLGSGGEAMIRLAAASPAMWTAICADNRVAIRDAVVSLRAQLDRVAGALDRGDMADLEAFFEEGRGWSSQAERSGRDS